MKQPFTSIFLVLYCVLALVLWVLFGAGLIQSLERMLIAMGAYAVTGVMATTIHNATAPHLLRSGTEEHSGYYQGLPISHFKRRNIKTFGFTALTVLLRFWLG